MDRNQTAMVRVEGVLFLFMYNVAKQKGFFVDNHDRVSSAWAGKFLVKVLKGW